MSYIGILISRMIKKYGQTINHKRRTQVDLGNGEVEYDYEVQEPKTGQFSQITPLDVVLNRFGERIEADWIATFLPGTDILEGDLLEIDDQWCEVQNIFHRRTSGVEDYLEVFLRRRQ